MGFSLGRLTQTEGRMGRALIVAGLTLVAAGLLWDIGMRLPGLRGFGDWVFRVGQVRIHVFWAASLLLSLILSLLVWLSRR